MLSPPYSDSGTTTPSQGLQVAIIGGGVTGMTLALGLEARGISYTLYERHPEFREIGAGFGFPPNAEAALKVLDPKVHAAFRKVAMRNGEDYFQWIDGLETDEVIYRLYLGERMFEGCRRSDFLDELVKLIPKEKVKFGKAAEEIDERADGKVRIQFCDGTSEVADIVIGCDGVHSNVRQILLGKDNPASHASYSHQFCFRALVSMDEAREALGDYRMSTRFMYNGPNAHLITYPVTEKHLNVMLAIHDPNPWRAGEEKHTAVGLKKEALEPLKDWHPTVRAVVDLMPDQMGKWAIFDNFAHPAPFYSKGSVCMAGDAAHAVGPHLGAGAGFGMEDALVLTILIEAADQSASIGSGRSRADLCHQMLQAYNDARYERTQWLVQKTREACDLFQRRFPGVGSDPDRFGEEISWRFRHIWNFDAEAQAKEAVLQLQRTLAQTTE